MRLIRLLLIPLVLLGAGVAASLTAGGSVERNEERRQQAELREDAETYREMLQSLASSFESQMTAVAAIATVTDGDPTAHRDYVVGSQLGGTHVLVDLSEPAPHVIAAAGGGAAAEREAAARAAALLAEPADLAQLRSLAEKPTFGFLLPVALPGSMALAAASEDAGHIYSDVLVFDLGPIGGADGAGAGDADGDVDEFAIYLGDRPDASNAIIASTDEVPLPGITAYEVLTIAGSEFTVEVSGTAKPTGSGTAVAAVGIAVSVALAGMLWAAERRRLVALDALAAAERAEGRLRAALDSFPDAVLLCDTQDQRVTLLNRTELFGHPADTVADVPALLEIVEPESRDAAALLSAESGPSDGVDLPVRDADGERVWARVRVGAMPRDDGTGDDALVIVANVTALRAGEEQRSSLEADLQRAQRMETVGQLAGGIAHDFNNLLAAIASTAEILASDITDPGALADIQEISEATHRGATLTRRLLTFSRRSFSAHLPLDLNAAVEDVAGLLRRTIGEDTRLELDLHDGALPVMGDVGEVEQVLLNLAVNARDASSGPGHGVCVSTRLEGNQVVLEVADDGVGMPAEVRERAFEPFFSTRAEQGGTGLGLAIVYGIVNRMQGDVTIRSELGEGTTVRISLPLSAELPTVVEAIPAETASDARSAEVVLLVEDEPAVRRAAQRLIERAGHEVHAVPDGHAAIAAVADEGLRPTVLLTDVVLPGAITGRDVAERVLRLVPGVRVVFASGYSRDLLSSSDLVDTGAVFVAKPFTAHSLLSAVSPDLAEVRR